ncbi:MAG: 23S rRNA (guanosine(2251)-2'-O)-methyltransferase RlmB [Gammaproteobacteria bacterium]|nr:23S rRNA (guanosine(2251)-2'-O)-methyltransferase RlmB [Gammaproteobacteria bacterium]
MPKQDACDLVAGVHAVLAALQEAPATIDGVWIDRDRRDDRISAIVGAARAGAVAVHRVPKTALDRLAAGVVHQGVIARRRAQARPSETDLLALVAAVPRPLLLILDGVHDPHNLGACLRTAEAAGAQAVVMPRHARAPLSAVAARAACGAAERLPVFEVANLARTLDLLKEAGVWLMGASADAPVSLHEADIPQAVAFVLGGEGAGLRRLTRISCDFLVRIPMHGQAESLNVSVAAALCLYEAVRSRSAEIALAARKP